MEIDSPGYPTLYVIADREVFSSEREWLDGVVQIAELLSNAPRSALQIRTKDDSGTPRVNELERAREAVTPFMRRGLPVLGNTTFEHARSLKFSGVHLSEKHQHAAKPLPSKRPDGFLIGVSAHSYKNLRWAEQMSANFVVLSPVYSPFSKPGKAMGLQAFEELTREAKVPVLALGGIKPDRVSSCMKAGAAGVSVLSSLMKSNNQQSTLRSFQLELERASSNLDSSKGDNNVI